MSRYRRVRENAFGIWVIVFRLFATRTQLSLVLHDMLRTDSEKTYTPPGFLDTENNGNITQGSWRDYAAPNILPLGNERGHRNNITAENIRQIFCDFFNGPGQVPWQWAAISK